MDHSSQRDYIQIQVEPESPPQSTRLALPEPQASVFTHDVGGDLLYSDYNSEGYFSGEVNQHEIRSQSCQSSSTLSPIVSDLKEFSLDDPFSGDAERGSSSEQEFLNDGLLFSPTIRAFTPNSERATPIITQHSFRDTYSLLQGPLPSPVEDHGRNGQVNDNSQLYLTVSPPIFYQWDHDNYTPSPFASPLIETPSSSRPGAPPSSLPSASSNHATGSFLEMQNTDLVREYLTPLEKYSGASGMNTSYHNTLSPSHDIFSPLNLPRGLGHSHVMLHSAPPSPAFAGIPHDTRRHSHSSGSGHSPQRRASLHPELAKFRQTFQPVGSEGDSSLPHGNADYRLLENLQIQQTFKYQEIGPELSSNSNLKDTIASVATLAAATKRRKKSALFACDLCTQKLTSKDNLMSHIDAHYGRKRFKCIYCDRDFRTRSVLARHQKSKRCPASTKK